MPDDASPPAEAGVRSLGHFEMLWDCGYCDAKGLLGVTHRHCPQCGAAQDEAKRYFPPEGKEQRVEGHRFVGTDRVCGSCATPQAAAATHCGHCGAPLDGAKVAALVAAPTPVAAPRRPWPRWVVAAIVAGVVALGGLIYWRCRTEARAMVVAGHTWTRTIDVEELALVTDSAWRDQVPADGALGACTERQRSTRQVPDGQDCRTERQDKGDGTFEQIERCTPRTRSEPVQGSWCSYTARRWRQAEVLRATGEGTDARWPDAPALPTPTGGLGDRRLGGRAETYTVRFTGGGRTQACEVSEARWRSFAAGATAKVTVRAASGDVVCGDL